jgi:hypothetical protein
MLFQVYSNTLLTMPPNSRMIYIWVLFGSQKACATVFKFKCVACQKSQQNHYHQRILHQKHFHYHGGTTVSPVAFVDSSALVRTVGYSFAQMNVSFFVDAILKKSAS